MLTRELSDALHVKYVEACARFDYDGAVRIFDERKWYYGGIGGVSRYLPQVADFERVFDGLFRSALQLLKADPKKNAASPATGRNMVGVRLEPLEVELISEAFLPKGRHLKHWAP